MNRKNGVDLFRLIGAFFIMLLHTSYGDLNHAYASDLRLLGRWAVPFFFMTTGYFMAGKIDQNKVLDIQKIQKNLAQLISILIVASIIYLPFAFALHHPPTDISNLLTGTYIHLWFVGALLFGYLFIWYIYFIGKSNLLIYISVFILIGAIIQDSYDQFLGKNIGYGMFRFLLSVPFMSLGIYFSKKNFSRKYIKILLPLTFAGVIIQFLEAAMFEKRFNYDPYVHQFLIGTIIMVVPMFLYSVLIDVKENKLSQWGNKYSLFIYLYHPLIFMFLSEAFSKLLPHHYGMIKIFFPVIAFALILPVAIFINTYMTPLYKILNGDFYNARKVTANRI